MIVAPQEAARAAGPQWAVMANRLMAMFFAGIGVAAAAIGLYLGAFAWMNDGAASGLELMLVVGGFGAAFLLTGACFRVVARSHATGSPRRWWLQLVLPLIAWTLFGLAAAFSSVVGEWVRG